MATTDNYRFYSCFVDEYKNIMKCHAVENSSENISTESQTQLFFVNKKIPPYLDDIVLDSQLRLSKFRKVFCPLMIIKSHPA